MGILLLFSEIARAVRGVRGTYNIYFSIVHASVAWRFFDVERACGSTVDSLVCPKVLTSLCKGACCTALRTSPKVCCLHRNSCPPRRSRRPICTPPSLSWNLLAQKRDRQISSPILMANVHANNAAILVNFTRYLPIQRRAFFLAFETLYM